MPSPSTTTHGKLGAIWRCRPSGFVGSGLNDAVWGTGFSGVASAYYEAEIMTEGTPDKYKWRKNGGAWDDNTGSGYDITGAAQTLDEGQQITFGATTGHTVGDKWAIGNLKDEACTESGPEAQITDAAKWVLNPNNPPVFTDDGSANVLIVENTQGKAVFDANVGSVTVTGNNGYIPDAALEKVGYLRDWDFAPEVEFADASRMGQQWEESLPGQARFDGGANAFYIGSATFWAELEDTAGGTQEHFFLELFNYDPDQDETGDHWLCWATLSGLGVGAPLKELVKERVSFKGQGTPSFVANT